MTSTLLFFSFSHYWETVETSSTMDRLDFYAGNHVIFFVEYCSVPINSN